MVAAWSERLSRFHAEPPGSERLYDLWQELTPQTPSTLAAALRTLLIDELRQFPSPELIYIPPRFHIGTILLTAGRFAESERWFSRALAAGIGAQGRFLAWRGDALTSLVDKSRAKKAYLAAFLEGPHEVDMETLQSRPIRNLLLSLEWEGEELGETDLPAWPRSACTAAEFWPRTVPPAGSTAS